jgi:hypothetical protein
MKLTVENLGTIGHADIDIAPLTVFIGPNNTNKTWTAYSLYGLVQAFAQTWWQSDSEGIQFNVPFMDNITSTVARCVDYLRRTNGADKETTSTEVKREELIANVTFPFRVSLLPTGLQQLLALRGQIPPSAIATLEVPERDLLFDADAMIVTLRRLPQAKEIALQYLKNGKPTENYRHIIQSDDPPLLTNVLTHFVRILAFGSGGTCLALPAERISHVSWPRHFMFQPPGSGSGPSPASLFSRPVSDFTGYLEQTSFVRGPLPSRSSQVGLAELLEERILAGKVGFKGETMPRSLEFAYRDGQSIRIHAASSLVKSLAALDLYLSGSITNRDFLVIDEPEMNAHPAAILAISELIAMLVNCGARVVITTHSPYIVDHLKNLVEASQIKNPEARSRIARRLRLGTEQAFLSPDKVAVYLFSGGNVTSIFDRDQRTVDWSTFSNASDELNNIYSDIIEALSTE